jgi:MFS family permease
MIVVCRLLHGIGLGQIASLSPLFISEVSPAHRRGLLIGVFSLSLGLGYTFVAWISFGTFHATNETLQWRLPLALAVVSPLLQAIGVWFVPESPRWLVDRNRKEEAWTVVRRLHHDRDDPSEMAARAEYTQICEQVEHDKQYNVSYWQMFARKSWRKRSLLVLFMLFASQSTGVLGIGNYNVKKAFVEHAV